MLRAKLKNRVKTEKYSFPAEEFLAMSKQTRQCKQKASKLSQSNVICHLNIYIFQKYFQQIRIELFAAVLTNILQGFFGRPGRSVGTIAGQGVPDIGVGKEP